MGITLYRVENSGDTILNRPNGEIMIFNNTDNVDIPNAFITDYDLPSTTGIGNNQAAEQDLGDHQDLGPVENLYTLRGFISQRDKTVADPTVVGKNDFITILKTWDEQTKVSDDFKHGRFGIKIDDLEDYTLTPIGTPAGEQVGLIWHGMTLKCDYAKLPLRADFEIQLLVDKGDDQ